MERLILLDNDNMCILKVHTDIDCLMYWADILIPKNDYSVRGNTCDDFKTYTDTQLIILYKALLNESAHVTASRERILRTIIQEIDSIELDTTTLDELKAKLGRPLSQIDFNSEDEDEDDEPALQRNASYAQNLKPPAEGTTTRRVWDLAEEIFNKGDYGLGSKLLRHAIITTCEQNGIHPSTAATQYAKWKKYHAIEA
jgi:hypothetical protein